MTVADLDLDAQGRGEGGDGDPVEPVGAEAAGDQLLVEDLPLSVRSRQQILVAATEPGDVLPLREVEQRYIAEFRPRYNRTGLPASPAQGSAR